MDSKVKVVLNPDGNLISRSMNNPEWGWYKVSQIRITINDEGIARQETLSALVQGWIKEIKILGWKLDDELSGKIIIKESTEPFNRKNPDRDLKIAGQSGVVCTINGKPIYRRYFYTVRADAQDQLIVHDNKEEIREMYDALRKSENVQTDDKSFSL